LLSAGSNSLGSFLVCAHKQLIKKRKKQDVERKENAFFCG
jgi:hypothetical protein